MLTKITIRNFKCFDEVVVDLASPVVFIGPNNSGKTTALQALALWEIGIKHWNIKRKGKTNTEKHKGITINRRDLAAVPVPSSKLLWNSLRVRDTRRVEGKQETQNIRMDIIVEGITNDSKWTCGLEFDYANEESFYCRPLRLTAAKDPDRMPIPVEAGNINIAFLPPMSGLAANETRLDEGAVKVRVGEGRTAEVLRNLCFKIFQEKKECWDKLVKRIKSFFGITIEEPERDTVVAFVGKPHRIGDRGSQVMKSLQEIGFEHYYQAEQKGWILYLEGSTDLAVLQTFAEILEYEEAIKILERPFVHYTRNEPSKAQSHFYALREAVPHLKGAALYDRLGSELPVDPHLTFLVWRKCEIENYLCSRETLEQYALKEGWERGETDIAGPLFIKPIADSHLKIMKKCINDIEKAMEVLGKGSPWDADTKVSDDFLLPLFKKYFETLGLPNAMTKKNFHRVARFVPKEKIDPEVKEKLDTIVRVAKSAKPVEDIP
jgi:hypothetical protein